MAFEKVSEFYKRAVDEKRFSEDFLAEAKSISNEDKLRGFFEEKVLPIAQSMGYGFTVDDLVLHERKVIRELSEEELSSVAGGASLKGISTAVMSFLMLAGNINPMSSAVISKKDIFASAERLAGPSSSAQGVDQQTRVLRTVSQAARAAADPEVSSLGLDRSDVVDSTEPCKNISSRYVCKALNLLDPYVLKVSGATQDIRFFDGNTTSVKVAGNVDADRIPGRQYNEDQGVGSTNYMRTLFPSSGGELYTEGGFKNVARFSVDCDPDPELVAGVAAYFHKFRNAADKDAMVAELNGYEATLGKDDVSNWTDEKLSERLYKLLQTYKKASGEFQRETKEKSLKQCVDIALNNPSIISDELLMRIKWNYFQNGLPRKYKVKGEELYKKLEEDSKLKNDELKKHIKELTYDQAKQLYDGVLSEIRGLLDSKDVLNHMKSNEGVYGEEVTKELKDTVRENQSKITFKDFVERKYPNDSFTILAISEEKEGQKISEVIEKYKDLLNLSKQQVWQKVKEDKDDVFLGVCMKEDEKSAREEL